MSDAGEARPDVVLDLPRTRQLSVGMRAYAEELSTRLPRVAPDLRCTTVARTSALDRHEQIDLALRLRRLRPRLVHHLSVYAPLAGPRPYIVTIHDLIHLRFPAYFKRSVGPYYRTVVRFVARRAARIITDDERTVGDLERFLGVQPRHVRIVPLGTDDAYHVDTEGPAAAQRPYFIYSGNRREHKNLVALLRAWEGLDPSLAVDLALTGNDDGDFGGAPRPQRAHGELRFLGELSAPDLAQRYRGAVALVYPSLCEGFGLPMLEAAAVGTPVIASSEAVPGVLRPYVQTFAPHDVAALVRTMERALAQRIDCADARRIARALTWDRCAERTAEVYRELLAEERR
ncbi:MAG: glycosyltransferase family 4 protein [Candidatus Eremiobacteraeota bacterium]|nr:glycosyltransferase family 4 protein [Candidatus Eremiobacteraeota bacterium]MBC5802163.1 glycosyltransferase family 4 protein [Candidatus Eremiobacteraeota bacterium]MBC5821785.1 glycosyltransferase family 4 protein [Candidatus Eremiobacteraeota bacterium]